MRSLLTTTSLVLVHILAAIPSLRVMAQRDCTTVLSDVAPAANTTFIVQSGECAGNIKIANHDVKIIFQPGAGEFQAGKSIVLPTTGVIVNFNLLVTGVNWALSQKVFSGGHYSNLELKGLNVEFIGSTITSSVSGPIAFSAELTGSSRYTVSNTTVSVVGSYAIRFNGAFTNSTLEIADGSALMATHNGYVSAIHFDAWSPVTDSTLSITDGSALTATGIEHGGARAIWFRGAFTDSTLVIKHGSVVEATSSATVAHTISFNGAFSTESTLCVTDDSVLKGTGEGGSAVVYPSTIENECPSVGSLSECQPGECPVTSADGNGASSVTAAALGLVTVALAAF